MRVLVLLLTLFTVSFAFPHYLKWFRSSSSGVNKSCYAAEFFQKIYAQTKKEYPSEKPEKLAKLMTKAIMNDKGYAPMLAGTALLDGTDVSTANVSYYLGFDGSAGEYSKIILYYILRSECDFGNFSMVFVPRALPKAMRPSRYSNSNSKFFQNHFSKKQQVNKNVWPQKCEENPKVQTVIDTIDKKNITNVMEYVETCADELYKTLNLVEVSLLKTTKSRVAEVIYGSLKYTDTDHCSHNPEDSRCFSCEEQKGDGVTLNLDYFED